MFSASGGVEADVEPALETSLGTIDVIAVMALGSDRVVVNGGAQDDRGQRAAVVAAHRLDGTLAWAAPVGLAALSGSGPVVTQSGGVVGFGCTQSELGCGSGSHARWSADGSVDHVPATDAAVSVWRAGVAVDSDEVVLAGQSGAGWTDNVGQFRGGGLVVARMQADGESVWRTVEPIAQGRNAGAWDLRPLQDGAIALLAGVQEADGSDAGWRIVLLSPSGEQTWTLERPFEGDRTLWQHHGMRLGRGIEPGTLLFVDLWDPEPSGAQGDERLLLYRISPP